MSISFNNLVDRMASASLSHPPVNVGEHACHFLNLSFPVKALLPPAHHLDLKPPTYVSSFTEPPRDASEVGVLTTDFTVRLMHQSGHLPQHSSLTSTPALAALCRHVECLGDREGSTLLEMASGYDWADAEIRAFFRFTTTSSEDKAKQLVSYHMLNDAEWKLLIFGAFSETWLLSLRTLVLRESYQAIYHVRERLEEQGIPPMFFEDRRAWNRNSALSVKGVFHTKTQSLNNANLSYNRERNYKGRDDRTALQFPCGHRVFIRNNVLDAMSDQDCLEAVCNECEEPVLTKQDFASIDDDAQKQQRQLYWDNMVSYKSLDPQLGVGDAPFDIWSHDLLFALDQTFKSLKTPNSIMHLKLSPLAWPETLAAQQQMFQYIHARDHIACMGAGQLPEYLVRLAKATRLGGEYDTIGTRQMPKAWQETMLEWFQRTAHTLASEHHAQVRFEHMKQVGDITRQLKITALNEADEM